MNNHKLRPLRIFISSVMENKSHPERKPILELRIALYDKLASYSFIEPYILEQNGTSALDLRTTYLIPLRESNLVIFLLDSHYEIPEGVQTEIAESRKELIPRIYFIIPGEPGEADKMKDDLLHQQETNFIDPLEDSNNYISIIEDSIFKQLVTVFQAYIFEQHHAISESDTNITSSTTDSVSTLLSSSQFSKEMFNQVGLSKQMIRQLVFHDKPQQMLIDPESALDESIQNLLDRLINNKKLPYYWDRHACAAAHPEK